MNKVLLLLIVLLSKMPQPDIKVGNAKPKKRETSFLNNKEQKKRIRQSFESFIDINEEFDVYIEKQYKKMVQEKAQNPTLNIPTGFQRFVQSKSFKQLLKKIYEYMEALVQYEKKFVNINKCEGEKIDSDPLFRALRLETESLSEKCKEISYAYMGVLLGYGDNKMVFKDQYFFETMLYFLTQILKQNFEGEDFKIVDEELNRIFRTNAFNLIKRRQVEDEVYEKYPALKQSKYDGSIFSVFKMEARLAIQKKYNYSMQIKTDRPRRLAKPLDIHLSTFHSVRSRSPLIASFYPSQKQKLFAFSKQVRQKQAFFKKNRGQSRSFVIRKRQTPSQ